MLENVSFTVEKKIITSTFDAEQRVLNVTIIESSGEGATVSVVDGFNSTSTTAAGSANNDRLLKGYIDNINTILNSDDTTLDELQEIVNFIKQNKTELETLGISNIAGLQDALSNKVDNSRVLTDVPENALFTDTIQTEEEVIGTATENETATGTVNLDLATFSDTFLTLTGNTTITVSNTPGTDEAFVKTATIKSTATETLTLPVSWTVVGEYIADGSENYFSIKFSNHATAGLRVICIITQA